MLFLQIVDGKFTPYIMCSRCESPIQAVGMVLVRHIDQASPVCKECLIDGDQVIQYSSESLIVTAMIKSRMNPKIIRKQINVLLDNE